MVKKLLSVIGLMALALGLLPALSAMAAPAATVTLDTTDVFPGEIGRASCRERV